MSHYFYITPKEYDTAASIGVNAHLLERRVRDLGWDKEKAISTPARKKTDRREWVKIAEQNGICYQSFMGRVNRFGWGEERAATEPLQDREEARKKGTDAVRKLPKCLVEKAAKNGIARETLRGRIRRGWDPEEAATKPLVNPNEAGRKGVQRVRELYGDFNGLIYKKHARG